jgi:hypothetical protein
MQERVTNLDAHWRIDSGKDQNIPLLSGLGFKAERLSCPQTRTPKLANAEADARDSWKLRLACKSRHGGRHYWRVKVPWQRDGGTMVGY